MRELVASGGLTARVNDVGKSRSRQKVSIFVKRILRKKVVLVVICFVAAGFAFINPASGSTDSGPTVNGWVISWDDDGWHQVQTVDGRNVCEGGRSCDVNAKGFGAGKYRVINHTNDTRYPHVTVSGSGSSTGADVRPDKPVIFEAVKKSLYVSVSWRPQPDVKQFDVFRNGRYIKTVFAPNNVYQDRDGELGDGYTVTAFSHGLKPSPISDKEIAGNVSSCDPTGVNPPISDLRVVMESNNRASIDFTGGCAARYHQVTVNHSEGRPIYLLTGTTKFIEVWAFGVYEVSTRSLYGNTWVEGPKTIFTVFPAKRENAAKVPATMRSGTKLSWTADVVDRWGEPGQFGTVLAQRQVGAGPTARQANRDPSIVANVKLRRPRGHTSYRMEQMRQFDAWMEWNDPFNPDGFVGIMQELEEAVEELEKFNEDQRRLERAARIDHDGDGVPDYLDPDTRPEDDADGDGIPDFIDDAFIDTDGDGIYDSDDRDDDNDGINDYLDDKPKEPFRGGGTPTNPSDSGNDSRGPDRPGGPTNPGVELPPPGGGCPGEGDCI